MAIVTCDGRSSDGARWRSSAAAVATTARATFFGGCAGWATLVAFCSFVSGRIHLGVGSNPKNRQTFHLSGCFSIFYLRVLLYIDCKLGFLYISIYVWTYGFDS